MKKTLPILLAISLVINAAMIYLFILKGEAYKSDDGRVEIKMSRDNQEFVLDEMRDFLESVQKINNGILNNDATKIIEAGKTSGGSVIDHAPKGLLKTLPVGFKELGFATHDIFDDITESAENNFNARESQKQLNTLLNNCITCHRAYKLETRIEQ